MSKFYFFMIPVLLFVVGSLQSSMLAKPTNLDTTPSFSMQSILSSQTEAPLTSAQKLPRADVLTYGRDMLSSIEQSAYDDICSAAFSIIVDADILLRSPLPPASLQNAFQAVVDDWPQLYWLICDIPVSGTTPISTFTLRIKDGDSKQSVLTRQAEIDHATSVILEDLPENPISKISSIHDRLLFSLSYQENIAQFDDGTLYGGLVNHLGVCDAYSRSFQYLAQMAGFPSFYICGTSIRGIPHSWNIVFINEKWYYADLTWNDTSPEKPYIYHDYFLTSSMLMAFEHFPKDSSLPPPSSTEEHLYYKYFGYEVDAASKNLTNDIATALSHYIEDFPPKIDGEPVFLELRLSGTPELYQRGRAFFQRELFRILATMDQICTEKKLPFTVETTGVIEYNFNDTTQVLILFPIAKQT